MAEDIGFILFVQILGMTEYPGAPFTGEIVRDIILFFFIPTVFIILFVWMLIGRFSTAAANPKLRLLTGISIYLFILASGYFPIFARLAGSYFMFLIFFMGIFYFVLSHFGVKEGALSGRALAKAERGAMPEQVDKGKIRHLLRIPSLDPVERNELEHQYRVINETLEWYEKLGQMGGKLDSGEVHKLIAMKGMIERQLYGKKL